MCYLFMLCVYCSCYFFVFFKQMTAYEMRISDWSSDVCSSYLTCIPLLTWKDELLKKILDTDAVSEMKNSRNRKKYEHRSGSNTPQDCDGLDRKSVVKGKSVSVRVDLGGRRIIKKKNNNIKLQTRWRANKRRNEQQNKKK